MTVKRIRVLFQYIEDDKIVYQADVNVRDEVIRGAHVEVLHLLVKTKMLKFWQFLVQMDKIDLFTLKGTK